MIGEHIRIRVEPYVEEYNWVIYRCPRCRCDTRLHNKRPYPKYLTCPHCEMKFEYKRPKTIK